MFNGIMMSVVLMTVVAHIFSLGERRKRKKNQFENLKKPLDEFSKDCIQQFLKRHSIKLQGQ